MRIKFSCQKSNIFSWNLPSEDVVRTKMIQMYIIFKFEFRLHIDDISLEEIFDILIYSPRLTSQSSLIASSSENPIICMFY